MTVFNPTREPLTIKYDGNVVTTIGAMEFHTFEQEYLYELVKTKLVTHTMNVRNIKATDSVARAKIVSEVSNV